MAGHCSAGARRIPVFGGGSGPADQVFFYNQQVPGKIDRLKQVFTNLFENAINHSNPGGTVAVELGLREDFDVIAVKDSGPGIPPEEMENIWERFYKVDKSRSRRGTGTGLGLSIVKNIVELHGGTVIAESQPGQGAVFTFKYKYRVERLAGELSGKTAGKG